MLRPHGPHQSGPAAGGGAIVSYQSDPNQSWGNPPESNQPYGAPPSQPYEGQPPGYQPYPNQPYANQPGQPVLAGWWYRVGATLIDVIIVGVVSGVLSLAGTGGRIVGVLVGVVYQVVLVGRLGRTVGQMAVGTKTLDERSGSPIGYPRALLRWFVTALLGITIIGGIIDDLWPLWDDRNQTLHDKVVSSVVVLNR
jgi:uncharacterized RDD family membrane protein YckC